MTLLLDNKTQGKVGDVLAENLHDDARLSILSSAFSIYAFEALRRELSRVDSVRLLLQTTPQAPSSPSDGTFTVPGLIGDTADRRYRNRLDAAKVARECAAWLERKAEVRAVAAPVAQNLYHVANSESEAVAIHGSSPFTSSGLGFTPSPGYAMNTALTAATETAHLLAWFDGIWNDPDAVRDVKAAVLAQLEELFSSKSPGNRSGGW